MAQQIKISAEQISLVEKRLLSAIADDLAALRATIGVLTAKLDADAGVTDTNYTALVATPVVISTIK
jgi:hypothetical protein